VGDRYEIDLDFFKASLSSQTGLLLLCNPHNPVGRVLDADILRQVAEICIERDILVCSDEVHCDLILDPLSHTPTATLDEAFESQSITLMSPSKTFNLPGFNCAVAIIPDPQLRRRFNAVAQGIVPHVGLMGFEAGLAAYRHGEPWRLALLDYLRGNRDLLESRIEQIPGLSMTHVEATYLAWIDTRALNLKHPQRFFEEAGVGLSHGRNFEGEGFVRLNFGCTRETLEEALRRIEAAVRKKDRR
jgi:cystathionine beta-lyase